MVPGLISIVRKRPQNLQRRQSGRMAGGLHIIEFAGCGGLAEQAAVGVAGTGPDRHSLMRERRPRTRPIEMLPMFWASDESTSSLLTTASSVARAIRIAS